MVRASCTSGLNAWLTSFFICFYFNIANSYSNYKNGAEGGIRTLYDPVGENYNSIQSYFCLDWNIPLLIFYLRRTAIPHHPHAFEKDLLAFEFIIKASIVLLMMKQRNHSNPNKYSIEHPYNFQVSNLVVA